MENSLIEQSGVVARLDRLSSRLVDFVVRFCAIDTTNPPGRNYAMACEFLQEKLDNLDLKTRIVRVPPDEQARLVPGADDYPRYSVIARWDVGAKKTLHFTGHYDVVPATSDWKTDPFKPVICGGKGGLAPGIGDRRSKRSSISRPPTPGPRSPIIIARGSSDMKGGDSAAIFAVQALRECGATPPWNIELSFTPDEETGGYAGLGWLVRSGQIKPDAAVLCEGGTGDAIGYAHRGVLWADVTVIGKPGHACNPKGGVNALEKAIPLIGQFKTLERVYAARRTRFNIRQKSPTLMIGGVCGGGGKTNTIPDRFHFTIDRRLNPEDRLADVKAELLAVVRRAQRLDRELKVKVDWPLYVPPGWTAPDAMISRTALAACRALGESRPTFKMTPGFTDLHFLTIDGGVPTIGYGAEGQGAHSNFEYVTLTELFAAARFYAEMMLRVGAEH